MANIAEITIENTVKESRQIINNNFANLNEALSTDVSLLKSQVNNGNIFGSSFVPTSSAGTRLGTSVTQTWTVSSDVTTGTDTFRKYAPFNTFEVAVKFNTTTEVPEIVAYEGDYNFNDYKTNDSLGADIFVMFPKAYVSRVLTTSLDTRLISATEFPGSVPSPMHYRSGVFNDYVGISKYGICNDGSGNICSRPNKRRWFNTTNAQLETLCRAKGYFNIGYNEISYLQHLGSIKYNNLNWQTAVGQGNNNSWVPLNTAATVTESGVSRVIMSNANAAKLAVGNIVYVTGTVVSGINQVPITSITTYDTDNMAVNWDSSLLTVNMTASTTGLYVAPLWSGGCDTVLGLDGESTVGTSGKRSVLTLGIEDFYGNNWKLPSGLCRIGTQMYINPNPDSLPAWPTSASDAISKGWVLFNGTPCATTGYIQTFNYDSQHPLYNICATVGGNSSYPVGDYWYTNADTTPKIARFGGDLNNLSGASIVGAFNVYINGGVADASFGFGSLCVFVP